MAFASPGFKCRPVMPMNGCLLGSRIQTPRLAGHRPNIPPRLALATSSRSSGPLRKGDDVSLNLLFAHNGLPHPRPIISPEELIKLLRIIRRA